MVPDSGKPGWFADPRHVPGGALIDEGIYWIELFEWFAGSPIVQVEAKLANLVHKDIEVEDWGMATFTFANGVIAHARSVVDDQLAEEDRPLAEAECRRPARTGRHPRRDHRSVVPIARARGARGWCRRLGLRAATRAERSRGTFPLALNHLVDCLENETEAGCDRSSRRAARSAPRWPRTSRRRRRAVNR